MKPLHVYAQISITCVDLLASDFTVDVDFTLLHTFKVVFLSVLFLCSKGFKVGANTHLHYLFLGANKLRGM